MVKLRDDRVSFFKSSGSIAQIVIPIPALKWILQMINYFNPVVQ